MKKILLILIGLALCVGITLNAQSTNTVTQPVPATIYSPGIIQANPASTAALQSSYLAPMLASVGLTVPSGAAVRSFTVIFYKDGSSRSMLVPCDPSKLPPPPSGL